ncbi:DUF4333 domain-containing protein [Nocardia acidivorans]|uniref:DUF4333 domain-containing protein n=1 Tax=Nocardia acidivorans TaxID=404580 RepID=UPI001471998B|nr:DUF4333 domain-containing protein [Nocardia acidivorans]
MSHSLPSSRHPSNMLLVVASVCAIAVSGLMLIVVLVRATDGGTAPAKPAAAQPQPQAQPQPVARPQVEPPAAQSLAPHETRLDSAAVEASIGTMLRSSYGITDVENVHCPVSMPARAGAIYDCSLVVGGENKDVSVRVTTRTGSYEVSRPS